MEKKKNYSLLKIVLIPLLVYLVLTWFIPTGSFSSAEFSKGDVAPLGLYGIFNSLSYNFTVFAQNLILILCIGGFYGVLNKTATYQRIVEFLSKKNKTLLLVLSVLIFSILSSMFGQSLLAFSSYSSLFGETALVFLLLPFFVAVLVKAGYDRVSSMAATIGASLVGMVASIGGNLAIYKNLFKMDSKLFIIYNIVVLAVLSFLLCMFIVIKDKKSKTKNEKAQLPLFESVKGNDKSCVPLAIVLIVSFLLIVIGSYNWYYSCGLNVFNEFHEKIIGIELFKTSIFTKVFGNFSALGYFTIYDVCAVLIISSIIISWLYNIKFNEYIEGFKNGAKEVLIPGIYVILACTVFSQVVKSSSNISLTISNSILKLSSNFNVFTGTLTAIVGSAFYNNFLYFVNSLYGIVSTFDATKLPLILSVFQSTFGVMMFVLPVSVLLIGGLRLLNISYKEWIKYIWIFLLQVFVITIIGNVILSMIV